MKYYGLVGALLLMSIPTFTHAADYTKPVSTQAMQAAPVPAPAVTASPAPVPMPAVAAKPVAMDISQQVDAAMNEYKQKNYGRAAKAMNLVAGQLRAMKSETLKPFLPAAPKGWDFKDDALDRFGNEFAGGSSASRTYTSGGEEVKLTIITDSRLMGAMRQIGQRTEQPMQFMGHDYVFKNGDTDMPEIVRKNEGILYAGDNLTLTVEGKHLTDQQAQGFLGLIDVPKLKIEAEK